MSTLTTRALDSAFGNPRGLLGRLGGAMMARGNSATELEIVGLAHLVDSDKLVVIGPGPGVGLRAAGERAARAIGIEPSKRMRQAASKRCAELIEAGRVELRPGTAEQTGLPESSFEAVLSVNNIQLWPGRAAGLAESYRLLRPGGLLLLSSHDRWLPGGRMELETDVKTAGFDEVQSWLWQPPGRGATTAAQLRARRPAA